MPNYVKNEISFFSEEKEKLEKFAKSIAAKDAVIDFEKIIPMPENIFRGNLGEKEMKLYGKLNWYDWSIENWGTKWNAFRGEKKAEIQKQKDGYFKATLIFCTAWSFPLKVMEKLSEMVEKEGFFGFSARYADEDFGYNAGIYEEGSFVPYDGGSEEAIEMATYLWGPLEEEEE